MILVKILFKGIHAMDHRFVPRCSLKTNIRYIMMYIYVFSSSIDALTV